MNLDLPEGAHVQIIVAPAGSAAMLPETCPAPPVLPRPRRRMLKGAAVLALIGTAYLVGQHTNPHGRPLQLAQAQPAAVPSASA
ncbi:MAG: hypothetical protein J2P47_11875, partial [Acetobacteraceae bacterium]|nr:hypothetical protein [Acetobacteraceae bacterium]